MGVGLGRTVLDFIAGAGVLEGMGPEQLSAGDRSLDQRNGGTAGTGRRELDAIVGEHRVDLVGDSREAEQEFSRDGGGGLLM